MANEIYDSTWWGNTRQTASSIGTSTEMIQGQFNLTKIGDELVTNGDFATDSDWVKQNGWAIQNGNAVFSGTVSSYRKLYQENILTIGKTYKLTFNIISISLGSIKNFSQSNPIIYNTVGIKTEYFTATFDDLFLEPTTDANLIIDNVSVKEVRATTVEASKCLADAIHRIGIQDIQN
jgi:hypothetical protein